MQTSVDSVAVISATTDCSTSVETEVSGWALSFSHFEQRVLVGGSQGLGDNRTWNLRFVMQYVHSVHVYMTYEMLNVPMPHVLCPIYIYFVTKVD